MNKRKIKISDLFDIKFTSDSEISPDGEKIAFTIKSVSKDRTKYHSNIYMIDIETSELTKFTVGDHADGALCWSPDSKKIAFVSDREGKAQIYCISISGGEAQKLTDLADGSISELTFSPCGEKLAFVYTPKKKRELFEYVDEEEKKKLDADKGKDRVLCKVITRLRYKVDGGKYKEDEKDHIYVLDLDTKEIKQVTTGDYDDFNPVFFPDGKKILFVSNRTENPDLNSFHNDLFMVSVDGGDAQFINTPPGPLFQPSISKDGKKVTYIGHDNPKDAWGVTNFHLWLKDLQTGDCNDIVRNFDRTCNNVTVGDMRTSAGSPSPVFSEDESSLYFIASDQGTCRLFNVDLESEKVEAITKFDGEVVNFSFSENKQKAALLISTLDSPGDIWSVNINEKEHKFSRLTHLNQDLLDSLSLSEPEEIHFPSKDKFMVHGWILKPPDFDQSKKYPMILEIHGGPRCQYAKSFFFEFHLLAAAGYVVLYTNPRGGQGYGSSFAGTIINDWGNVDYQDLMSGVDFMLEKGYIDHGRLGVTGGSYGGYMTNWIVGHTNRFKAAITLRSVSNLMSMFGTCDFGYDIPREFGGSPWENLSELLRMSPLSYVQNINTPLLIIHSEQDLRTCIEQAEQLFVALKVLGKEVTFLRFPDESHELSRSGSPDRRAKGLEWILKWFDEHLK
ncbi:S9 family peptidase [bacterium]|nr:S9 family peptidase [bacterium]